MTKKINIQAGSIKAGRDVVVNNSPACHNSIPAMTGCHLLASVLSDGETDIRELLWNDSGWHFEYGYDVEYVEHGELTSEGERVYAWALMPKPAELPEHLRPTNEQ